jgi:hypothetical protein
MNNMPLKDLTSYSASSFASDRKLYANNAAIRPPSIKQNIQKKWIGGQRDASYIAYKRRITAVGSSLNPTGGPFSFISNREKNTRIDALNRCRNGGYCVPPKVRASLTRANVPTPIWKTPNLIRTQFRAVLAGSK